MEFYLAEYKGQLILHVRASAGPFLLTWFNFNLNMEK